MLPVGGTADGWLLVAAARRRDETGEKRHKGCRQRASVV
jgi:hypothetical protein